MNTDSHASRSRARGLLPMLVAAVPLIVLSARAAAEQSTPLPAGSVLVPVAATLAFALAALGLRGVDLSGAVVGWAIALALWLAAGWRAFAALLAVFVVTWAATRFGYARKLRLGAAERRGGRRSGAQVLANVGAAAAFAALGPAGWIVVAMAVLCEATADTVSSEIGQALGRSPRMVTTLRPAEPGTNGAVSLEGTLAGAVGAILVAATACYLGLLPLAGAALAAAVGVAGMFLDSLLGATLERRGMLGNDAVNGISTVASGLLAWLLVFAMR